MHKLRRTVLFIIEMPLVWAAFSLCFYAQRPVESGYRGLSYSFRTYRPQIITKLSEIPMTLKNQLMAHLIQRLGKDFYSKLKFDWCEKVNLNDLYSVEPIWGHEDIAAYTLIFHVSDKPRGLKSFYCRIGLDENGQVVNEINLPKISEQPQKAELISSRKALEIAQRNGFDRKSSPHFDYKSATDSFVWVFRDGNPDLTKQICRENTSDLSNLLAIGSGPYGEIQIEAHTGRVLKIDCYRIVV